MTRRRVISTAMTLSLLGMSTTDAVSAGPRLEVQQLTSGPKHHFFGYIGHAGTCPWDGSNRYILALQAGFQDHMPRPDESAEVVLIDTRRGNALRVVDRTHAWNFQQGTMFYWNPEAPETQFFFNDRDPKTGKVFCVLFDLSLGPDGRRLKEFRFDDASIGNSGVAQKGGAFLALNYGRLARLRPVTGYPGAFDPTLGVDHPEDDGLFRVGVKDGEKRLIVSYRRIADELRGTHPGVDRQAIFINHSLWNRDDDRIFFYARADFEEEMSKRLDALFVVDPDGGNLRRLRLHLGGHLDWERGHRLIGTRGDRIALFDTDRQEFVGDLGEPDALGDPNGDKALSSSGDWFVNGFRVRGRNTYAFLRRPDATVVRSREFDPHGWLGGPLRIDPAPCWDRKESQVLLTCIADDPEKTRQLFVIRLMPDVAP